MAITDEKYVLLTTFRRDGTPVKSPVWVVALDQGRAGFWTSSASGKVKRLANNPSITMQPSDARGRVKAGSGETPATAVLVHGAEFEEISAKVRAKYGAMVGISKVFGTIDGLVKGKRMPYGDVGVLVTFTD